MRCAVCARVSSKEKQADNFSIPTQLEAMRSYAVDNGHEIVAEFTDTSSAFQDGLTRSALNAALDLARKGQIQGLIFFSSDRFTRDMGDGVILRRELYRLGVRLVFVHPFPHEITSDNELLNLLEDWKSQQYVENFRAASMRGRRGKAMDGLYTSGTAPYGYQLVGRRRESHLEVVEEQAAIVRWIFKMHVVDGLGTVEIARRLTEAGIPTPGDLRGRRKVRRFGEWCQQIVFDILRHEVYAGIWHAFRFKLVAKGKHVLRPRDEWLPIEVPAIVDRGLWMASQDRLDRKAHRRHVKQDYLARGRITCACGYRMSGHFVVKAGRTGIRYYRCSSHNCARGRCGGPYARGDAIDATLWNWLKKLLREPEHVLQSYQETQALLNDQQSIELHQIELIDQEIADYQHKLKSTLDLRDNTKSEALISTLDQRAEEYAGIVDELRAKRAELVARLDDQIITDEQVQGVMEFIAMVRGQVDDVDQVQDFETQRALVEALNLDVKVKLEAGKPKFLVIRWLLRDHEELIKTPVAAHW